MIIAEKRQDMDEEKNDIKEIVDILSKLDKANLVLAKQSVETIRSMEILHDKKAG